ncbi:ribonuclease HII [Salipaludibacillus sp. CUR1]|uniref:ribonuclease HII n=1 Tax=Salipaludibacillus sp. CUR1 TaxID=2820003 RepID=UPI001E4632F4|nr:ribonuclease HII [Salipaludibacillus sp. CUR1]MCE7794623.1 ribonuclease HII [Salipaludibacillus sp. CUR1]
MKKKTIAEIKCKLETLQDENDPFLEELHKDERKGVKGLIARWEKQQVEREKLESHYTEMSSFEKEAWNKGYLRIAGIDEVGRGPLAGPVIASCVVLPSDCRLLGLTDSKKLTKTKREYFYDEIMRKAEAVGVGIVSAQEIDELNIYQASKQAMIRAVKQISEDSPDYLLIDAMELPLDIAQKSLIKGDSRSVSIAASSIIAKVTRDRYMDKLHKQYPMYQFDKHAGYGTRAHLEAIEEHGILEEHRRSFAPVKSYA